MASGEKTWILVSSEPKLMLVLHEIGTKSLQNN